MQSSSPSFASIFFVVLTTLLLSPTLECRATSKQELSSLIFRGLHFAIGIDLTDSYATSSATFRNIDDDSLFTIPVTKVLADEPYRSMIRHMALNTSRYQSPPYEYWHDGGVLAGLDDQPRQLLRWTRKKLGLPADANVGRLSNLISNTFKQTLDVLPIVLAELNVSVESDLYGSEIRGLFPESIVLSSMDLTAFYDEDIPDAVEYAGLKLLTNPWIIRPPKHFHSYSSAYGRAANLTQHDIDYPPCLNQSRGDITGTVLAHLTDYGLEVACEDKWTNRTCSLGWGQHRAYFDEDLGLENKFRLGTYWAKRVRELVQKCVRGELYLFYRGQVQVTDVMFAGEHGDYGELLEVVLGTIADLQPKGPRLRIWPEELGQPWMNSATENGIDDFHQIHMNDNKQMPITYLRPEKTQRLMEFGGSMAAAKMAWQILEGETPNSNTTWNEECLHERRRKADGSGIPIGSYGVRFW